MKENKKDLVDSRVESIHRLERLFLMSGSHSERHDLRGAQDITALTSDNLNKAGRRVLQIHLRFKPSALSRSDLGVIGGRSGRSSIDNPVIVLSGTIPAHVHRSTGCCVRDGRRRLPERRRGPLAAVATVRSHGVVVTELGAEDDVAVAVEFLHLRNGSVLHEDVTVRLTEELVAALADGVNGVVGVGQGAQAGDSLLGQVDSEADSRGLGLLVGWGVGVVEEIQHEAGIGLVVDAHVVLPREVGVTNLLKVGAVFAAHLPHHGAVLREVVARPHVTQRDQVAVVGGCDGVHVVGVVGVVLGAAHVFAQALVGAGDGDIGLVVKSAPRVDDVVCADVDLVELTVQHPVGGGSVDGGQVVLGDIIGGANDGVARSDVTLVQVAVGVLGRAIGGDEVSGQADRVDFLVRAVEDVNRSVAVADVHHFSSPEGDDVFVEELLHHEVGRDLLGAFVHQVPGIIVNQRGRTSGLDPSTRTDEDIAGIGGAGLVDIQLRWLEVHRAVRRVVPGGGLQGQQQSAACVQPGSHVHDL